MPWSTPTLKQCREIVRDDVTSALSGAVLIANSVLRVIADATAGMAHLVLRFIDWLARQLMPDTAEKEWLDRHGDIWLVNEDESIGRKSAKQASGTVTFTGIAGTIVPKGTLLTGTVGGLVEPIEYETTEQVFIGVTDTSCTVLAINGGVQANLLPGDVLTFSSSIIGVDGNATIVRIDGGVDEETDDELRMRVLERIQQPPMGGDAEDYVLWALQVPGVTRAWSAPLEMGMGTVTVRFMCDDLRATTDPLTNGFPLDEDIAAVQAHLNTKRPVAVKDFFVVSPIPEPIDFALSGLSDYSASTLEAITLSVTAMLREKAAPGYAVNGITFPGQTIYTAWVSDAVLDAFDARGYFDLQMVDHVMPTNGHLAVLGTISYA